MDYSTINYEIEDSVALITLSRPDNLNAFTIEMSHEPVSYTHLTLPTTGIV